MDLGAMACDGTVECIDSSFQRTFIILSLEIRCVYGFLFSVQLSNNIMCQSVMWSDIFLSVKKN